MERERKIKIVGTILVFAICFAICSVVFSFYLEGLPSTWQNMFTFQSQDIIIVSYSLIISVIVVCLELLITRKPKQQENEQ